MKTIEVPASKKEVNDKVICDVCMKEIDQNIGYDVDEVNVSHRTGSQYPEGGSGETISVDICGKCFDERLVLWLKSQGANPVTKDWDW